MPSGCRLERNGAGDGIRTRDIDLGKVALYQLSYSRLRKRNFYFSRPLAASQTRTTFPSYSTGFAGGSRGPCVSQLYMAHYLSQLLEQMIQREAPLLRAFPEAAAGIRPGGEATWSPKEELGHLIDSAANNHIRFVRASFEPEFRGPSYAQNDWVRAHGYQEMQWSTIVDFWLEYNSFVAVFLTRVPETKLQTACFVGSGEAVSLQFLVEDYILHMQHHIDHLLGRELVTAYPG